MKRIATAAVAATVSLSAVATPAFAAEEKVGSSEAYKECKTNVDRLRESKEGGEDRRGKG